MFEFMDRLNHKINEHLRSTSFEEKSALNISGKFEFLRTLISTEKRSTFGSVNSL